MSKEQFLRNPLGYEEDADPEWVAEGWADSAFREDVIYILARSLSKTGTFHLAGDLWFQTLPKFLSVAEAVALYQRLRDDSERLELEWRDTFIQAFPFAAQALPPSQDRDFLLADLNEMLATGNGLGLESVLATLAQLPGAAVDIARFATEAERAGQRLFAVLAREAIANMPIDGA